MLEIGIVNYNGGDALRKCIHSLLSQETEVQIHIWDNASTDQDYRPWALEFPKVQFYFDSQNLGYAHACNRLVEKINSDYFALANMDCIFESNWSRTILEELKANPYIDALGTLVLEITPDGTSKINAYSVRLYSDLHPCSPEDGMDPNHFHAKAQTSFAIYGAAMVFKKQAYIQVGGMDESYFLYYEEADLFWKFNLHQLNIKLIPHALVKHYRSWSTGSFSKLKLYYSERNRTRSCVKYLPLIHLFSLPLHSVHRIRHTMKHNLRLKNSTQKKPHPLKIVALLGKAWLAGLLHPASWLERRNNLRQFPDLHHRVLKILNEYKYDS